MKKIFVVLAVCYGLLNADVQLTKELLSNSIETNEYQLFVTKTVNIPTDNLTAKVVFMGSSEEYYEKYDKEYSYFSSEFLQEMASKIIRDHLLGGGREFFGDARYIQVTDYTQNDELKTRTIKYIVSDENLPEDDQKMIYNTTETDSYHFNKGKIRLLFSTNRELTKFEGKK